MRKPKKDKLPDRLSVGISRYIVLRSAVADALISYLRFPNDLFRLPIVVFDDKNQSVLSDDYVLLHSDTEYDVLDREHAKYSYVSNTEGCDVIISVSEWHVMRGRIPDLDAFFARPNDWIVSDQVLQSYVSNGFTGGKFKPVAVTQ